MGTGIFEPFRETIEGIPPRAILQTVEDRCHRLQNDVFSKLVPYGQEVISILTFNRFLASASGYIEFTRSILPAPHLAFFRKTVARLVEAKELPADSLKWFDKEFSSPTASVKPA
jgi:hypothetical protein